MRTSAFARIARIARTAGRGLAAFAVLGTVLVAVASADHKDARLGFSIQTPREWNAIPQKADEAWLVANYQSNKPYFHTEKGGWTSEHKPDMQAIAFVSEQVKERAKVERKKDKKGNDVLIVDLVSPYKDYKDYMARRYTGGGWYVDKEEKIKVGDVDVTAIEIRVDKLSYDGPKRIVTWIYHLADLDLAVQFEVLQDSWPKISAEVTRCLKSFKTIPRSGEALVRDVSTGRKYTILEADELTPEERKGWRQSEEQTFHERAGKGLPAGWNAKKFGRFLVVYSCDEKFARKVADQAEAVWQWLDTTFPFVGEKEYVRAPVLRVCKSQDEMMQFQKAGDWNWNNLEIVTCQDYGGSTSWYLGAVNRGVLDVWFGDRDRELYWAMPAWLSSGLREVVAQARVDKGRIEFKRDDWNRDEVRSMVKDGRARKPRDLMMLTDTELMSGNGRDYWDVHGQSQAFVTFLATGPAAKNARTKSFLQDYVKSLKAVQVELKRKKEAEKGTAKDDGPAKPKTEEEEARLFKEQAQGYKQAESDVLERAFQRAFGGWTDKDWEQFDSVYFQAIG